jgi:hypothetical protein
LLGLTSVLRSILVNDFRFSYFFVSASVLHVQEQDCPGCLGVGAPGIAIARSGLYIGRSASTLTLARRFHVNDSISW